MVRDFFYENCSDYNLRLHRSPFSAKYGAEVLLKQCVNT